MVVDNVDDRRAFFDEPLSSTAAKTPYEYLPRCGHGALVFTTRNRDSAVDLAAPAEPITVSGHTPAEGHELLRERRLPGGYLTDLAGELLAQLEHIPLAITQAVAFMTKRRKGIAEYLALFAKSDVNRTKLLSFEFADHARQGSPMESVARTWTLSFEWIRDSHKEGRRPAVSHELLPAPGHTRRAVARGRR